MLCTLQRCCGVSDFEGMMSILRQNLRWVRNIALASLQLHLIDLPAPYESKQPTSCDVCVAPMRQAELHVVLRLQAEGVSCPSQQRLPLADDPVLPAIEIDRDNTGYGRLGRDQSCDWCGGRNLLVEERNADGRAPEWFQEGQSRYCVL